MQAKSVLIGIGVLGGIIFLVLKIWEYVPKPAVTTPVT